MITLAYTVCAIVGVTVLVVLLILMFLGLHGDGGFDVGHGGDFAGGDFGHDLGGMGDADVSGVDLTHDGQVHMLEDTQVLEGGAASFFQVLSFRSLIAAMAFFGVGGRLATELGWHPVLAFVFALGMGGAAMLLVAWLMALMASLRHDGTIRILNAIGLPANVYLGIPGRRMGVGRVQFTLQERTVEMDAVTDGQPIPTGSQVIIVDVVNDTTVAVQREAGVVDA